MTVRAVVVLPLSRLSICPCGGKVLDDSIQVGVKYTVALSSTQKMVYGCGDCGREFETTGVLASQQLHPERPMAYLPIGLFDVPKESEV